jgi:enoyl-CoA hydratase/carnithine racemase
MRFGAIGKAIFHQAEASLGIIAGGGGTIWLTRLLGRARAMEVMLGLTPLTAKEAERYGWINRAIPAQNLDQYVRQLAFTIAYVPAETIKIQKQSMLNAETMPVEKALLEESHLFALSAGLKETKNRMKTFLDSAGQSRDSEMNIIDRANEREKLLTEE